MGKLKWQHDPLSHLTHRFLKPIGWPKTIYQYSGFLHGEDIQRYIDGWCKTKRIEKHKVRWAHNASSPHVHLFIEAMELRYLNLRNFERDFAHCIR